ncbi:hypothetical protein BDN72DRAFT_902245 [Pluteus cervinus]|uniref:Uncharacterized protein n=1 Tax=Pluteus cervinus TaxID=181527 RepID=A0ACD3AD91_9AGAR|nr:hypothetical protein BDN72DRAFT_902245 [Pluteus cervinus]
MTSPPPPHDELTSTVFGAIQALSASRKANFLLDTALSLIEVGQYGSDVENYIEVYLKTPNLPKADIVRALVARGKARKAASDRLLARAHQDFQTVARIDPGNRKVQSLYRKNKLIHFAHEPASQRAPPEIWERIAMHIPRYHLRTWLFVSSFHRDIAVRHIFHTIDLYFGEDPENLNRGLDIFDRAKADPIFASRVKSLRVHWAYEEGDMLDLMARIFRTALPEFKALKDFEWIGYPEMRIDMVDAVLSSHPRLHGLGLIGWHFDAVGVSAFRNLRKFTLRAEDDDGFADMGEVRTVLDQNESTLRHLILGAYLARHHSWDTAFQSVTIKNLTHLDLVDTRISHIVLARIAHAHNLQSLTLHGTFEEPSSASVVFGSDHVIDGKHTFLPHLEAFRFVLVGQDENGGGDDAMVGGAMGGDAGLYQNVTQFLRKREKLRRLDLGSCPWEMVASVLPELKGLRVLGVRIENVNGEKVERLVESIPREMVAIHLSTLVSEVPMNKYAPHFSKFHSLQLLHFQCSTQFRPKPNLLSEKEYQMQTEVWSMSARSIALEVGSVDFVGWHGEHYVVVRHGGGGLGVGSVGGGGVGSGAGGGVLGVPMNVAKPMGMGIDDDDEDDHLALNIQRSARTSPVVVPVPTIPAPSAATRAAGSSSSPAATVSASTSSVHQRNSTSLSPLMTTGIVPALALGNGSSSSSSTTSSTLTNTTRAIPPPSYIPAGPSSTSSYPHQPGHANAHPHLHLHAHPNPHGHSHLQSTAATTTVPSFNLNLKVELKELPARRRLDCGKGVDLGGEDAAWLERKDVPMDYEMPGLGE